MTSEQPEIPSDLAECQALLRAELDRVESLSTTAEQLTATVDKQSAHIEKLERELQLFRRHLFGQRRERFVDDPRQQKLFEVDGVDTPERSDEPAPGGDDSPPRRRRGRRPLPDFLPRQIVSHELQGDELLCPCCGKPRVKVSEKTSEQLEFQPASLFVLQHVRFVYACQEATCTAHMQTADKPPQAIEKGLAGPGLLAFIIASKFADHLPLNRLEDILTRHGLHVARSTQCDWMAACAELVTPLYRLLMHETLKSYVLGTDDTPVPVQDPELDRTRTGRFWAYWGDELHPYVCYDFTPSRSRDGPAAFLRGFQGYLQGDAYAGYVELARASQGAIQHAGCWAHARRYFDRAREKAPDRAVHEALAFIQRLYDIEDQAARLSADQRVALRRERSTAIVDQFRQWLSTQEVLPSSLLGEAITYTRNQWDSLCLYLRDGRIPIDNNRTERALRQQVLGRNNWLFVGSENGGRTAAVLFSLVASCKRLRIDPYVYLRDVLSRLPALPREQLAELLPDRWVTHHPESRLEHREREATRADERRRERRQRRRQLARKEPKRK